MVAGAVASPAGAANGDPVIAGRATNALNETLAIMSSFTSLTDRAALFGGSDAFGGVAGVSQQSFGVSGRSVSFIGVTGSSESHDGVSGSSGTFAGVRGTSESSVGVFGTSGGSTGVRGSSGSTTGFGVDGTNTSNVGVQGVGGKIGVSGVTFTGIGGSFAGGTAAVRLVPRNVVGKPTTGSHQRGEMICDSLGALYVCTANGTPGTWPKITVSAA